jgi:hypothetical protein
MDSKTNVPVAETPLPTSDTHREVCYDIMDPRIQGFYRRLGIVNGIPNNVGQTVPRYQQIIDEEDEEEEDDDDDNDEKGNELVWKEYSRAYHSRKERRCPKRVSTLTVAMQYDFDAVGRLRRHGRNR